MIEIIPCLHTQAWILTEKHLGNFLSLEHSIIGSPTSLSTIFTQKGGLEYKAKLFEKRAYHKFIQGHGQLNLTISPIPMEVLEQICAMTKGGRHHAADHPNYWIDLQGRHLPVNTINSTKWQTFGNFKQLWQQNVCK